MTVAASNGNGQNGNAWRSWILGIVATIVGTLVVNGIVFQRDTRRDLGEHEVKLKYLTERMENILKFTERRIDEKNAELERRIERMENTK